MSIVKDPALAEAGRKKIQWVRDFMPALSQIEARFLREKPFQGLRVAVSVHLEAKTANLGYVLQQGGAEVYLTGSNPLSTQDDVAAGLGARVIVTEIDPFKALDATMNGFQVMTMDQAAPLGDVFVTVTGCRDVIVGRHFAAMKDNVLLANAGHFDCEVAVAALREMAARSEVRRENIVGYTLPNGHTLNVLAEGRLVNLAAGNGHPAEIMDMSFAVQALAAEWLTKQTGLEKKVYPVPDTIDDAIGRAKLAAQGLSIDALTPEQEAYLSSWSVE